MTPLALVRPYRIKPRILGPFSLVLVLVIAAFLATAHHHEEHQHELSLAQGRTTVEQLLRQRVDLHGQMMEGLLPFLADRESLRAPFLAGDRQGLLAAATPLFHEMTERHRITHLYFLDADRRMVLRVHKPERFGDIVERRSALDAERQGKTVRGIELGPLGTLTLRVIAPWRNADGTMIGYLELGVEIQSIVEDLHAALRSDFVLLVRKEFLERAGWEQGMRMLGREAGWDRLPSHVLVLGTRPTIPPPLRAWLAGAEAASPEFEEDGKAYLMDVMPMEDMTGRQVAFLATFLDVTAIHRGFSANMRLTATASILAGLLVFGLFVAILGRVEAEVTGVRRNLEEKVAERTRDLSQREDDLRRAQAVAHVGSWNLDLAANRLALSEETHHIFGRSPAFPPLTYEGFLDLVHPDDRAIVDAAWKAALAGAPYDVEHRILVDGTLRWVREQAEITFPAEGGPGRSLGTVQDITAQKRLELSLRENVENQTLMARILELSVAALPLDTVLDEALRLILSSEWLGILGKGCIFLSIGTTGKLEMRAQAGLDAALLEKCINIREGQCLCGLAASTGDIVHAARIDERHEIVHKDLEPHGHICVPLQSEGRMLGVLNLYVPEGHVASEDQDRSVRTIANALAVTILRRQAEEALRSSERTFRSMAEASPAVIVISRISDGTVLFCNAQAASVFRIPMEGIVGSNMRDYYAEPAQRDFLLQRLQREGTVRNQEFQFRRGDGSLGWALVSLQAMDFMGERAVFGVAVDVTELRRTRSQLVQAAKRAVLGDLTTGIAHEINQPLAIIRIAAETARMGIEEGAISMDKIDQKLATIADQAERAVGIIQHVRSFAHDDSAGDREAFDPLGPVSSVLEMVVPEFRSLGIELAAGDPPESCPAVQGFPLRLEQVLMNLLANARDAVTARATSGSAPEGYAPRVMLTVVADAGCHAVRIAVSDNGGGIPAAIADRIFDPYFTTKKMGEGTGVGLAISQAIVHDMGGEITARNLADGAEFTVALPIRAPGTPAADHLLLVDDDEVIRHVIAEYLEHEGFPVLVAHDGTEALDLFDSGRVAAVVSDLRMPEMNGLELTRRIRARDATVPIVIISGCATSEDERRLRQAGATGVLRKTEGLSPLLGLLRRLTGTSRPL